MKKNSKIYDPLYDPLGRLIDVMLFVADFAIVAGCFLAVVQAIGL
jgi:hypothetical protein|nr:MAG TPA: hypothetical protein [Caudoviricetes sp.]